MIVERDSIESDCEELAKHLRKPDFDEVVTVTKEAPLKPIVRGFRAATYCKSVLNNGNMIMMYGVCPTLYHKVGSPFLLGTDRFLEVKLPFARQCKSRVEEMQKQYPILWNFIDSRNTVHLRWIKWCGFKLINKKYIDKIKFYEFIRIKKYV
jgi:hypothetical protein|tara:strand:+ start:2079 stop:2534 length:456 start_codon:yes stop_codon:yes gene_type:complete